LKNKVFVTSYIEGRPEIAYGSTVHMQQKLEICMRIVTNKKEKANWEEY